MRQWLRFLRADLDDWWYFRVLALVPVRRTRFREQGAELERAQEEAHWLLSCLVDVYGEDTLRRAIAAAQEQHPAPSLQVLQGGTRPPAA